MEHKSLTAFKKGIFWAIPSVIISTESLFGQRGYDMPRSYEIYGLAPGEEVLKYFGYAILSFFVAFLVIKIFGNTNENSSSENSNYSGCFAWILVLGGIFCLVPLFAYIEFIFMNLLYLGLLLFIILIIIALVYSALKPKSKNDSTGEN